MNRREAIQKATLSLGYAISASAMAGVLKGCTARPELTYKPEFFTEDQAALVSELTEIILPKTTTPGAKDVGVPGFIDSLLKEVYVKEEQEKFMKGLEEFNLEAKKELGDDFVDADSEKQQVFFKKKHDEALALKGEGGGNGWWNTSTGAEKPFVMKVKELTILGFFTSEQGATQVLQYSPVPGPFQGCVPLAEVGKTWAT